MRFFRAVRAQASAFHSLAADFAAAFGLARSEKADDVGHVAAADEQASAIGGVVEHLRDPANGLRLDLAGHGREQPRSAIGIHGGSEQFAQCADGRGRRGDVTPEARMRIETGNGRRAGRQRDPATPPDLRPARGRERSASSALSNCRRRFARGHRPLRNRVKEIGDAIDELMTGGAKLIWSDVQRRCALCEFQFLAWGASLKFYWTVAVAGFPILAATGWLAVAAVFASRTIV